MGVRMGSGVRITVELGVAVAVLLFVHSAGRDGAARDTRTAERLESLTKTVEELKATVAPLPLAVVRLEERPECSCRNEWQVEPRELRR